MKKYLVIIIDRISRETLAEYNDIMAEETYYARRKALNKFEREHPELLNKHDYCADSLCLDSD